MVLVVLIGLAQIALAGNYFNLAAQSTSGGVQISLDMASIDKPSTAWTLELWTKMQSANSYTADQAAITANSGVVLLYSKGKD